jgi:hypothetical protein
VTDLQISHSSPIPSARERLVAERIEERLRRFLNADRAAQIRDAVVRGQVVHAGPEPSIVAFKRGVLFVAGREYVISDD